MKKFSIVILVLVMVVGFYELLKKPVKRYERYYQTQLCNDLDGKMEYVLKDRTRVDCLTDDYAIEVDFAKKWAESIGQSLFYAEMTNRDPAIGLIVDSGKDEKYLKRLKLVANKFNIKIFEIEK
jgi:hypothetical protein